VVSPVWEAAGSGFRVPCQAVPSPVPASCGLHAGVANRPDLLSRRQALGFLAGLGAGAVAVACGGQLLLEERVLAREHRHAVGLSQILAPRALWLPIGHDALPREDNAFGSPWERNGDGAAWLRVSG
jgi:hypothetical protein